MNRDQALDRLAELQAIISTDSQRVSERDALLAELHQVHRVKQSDLLATLNEAATTVGGRLVTISAVERAIRNQLGRKAGRVA